MKLSWTSSRLNLAFGLRQEKEHVIFLTLFCLFEKVSIVRNHKELRLWAPLRYAHNKTDMTQRVQFATNVLAS